MSIANRCGNGENAYVIWRWSKMMIGWFTMEHVKNAWNMHGMMNDERVVDKHVIEVDHNKFGTKMPMVMDSESIAMVTSIWLMQDEEHVTSA
jgi:hypothetical protein